MALVGTINTPNDFGFKNRIINGAMVIDQRNAGAAWGTSINGYTVDRWALFTSVTGKINGGQNYNSITPPVGFKNYIGIQSQSAYSLAAGDYFNFDHRIEGFNVADLEWGTASAATVTLSFWVRSSLTGAFGASLRNDAGNRSYPFLYTINAANTWEQKTVTIAGDTSGTWLTTNGLGILLTLTAGGGSTYTSSSGNSWQSANYFTVTGATSVVGTNGATFYITGVQLEKGSTATSFDYKPYGTELALCQRYFEIIKKGVNETLIGVGFGYAGEYVFVNYPFKATKRTEPTVEYSGTSSNLQCLNGSGSWNQSSGGIGFSSNIQSMRINCPITGISNNNACEMRIEGNGIIKISAEL